MSEFQMDVSQKSMYDLTLEAIIEKRKEELDRIFKNITAAAIDGETELYVPYDAKDKDLEEFSFIFHHYGYDIEFISQETEFFMNDDLSQGKMVYPSRYLAKPYFLISWRRKN